MTIGIDGNEANISRRVGIGEYAYQLLLQFYALRQSHKTDVNFTIYLKDSPVYDIPKETSWWKYKIVRPRRMWTQMGLPISLYTSFPRPNVFFTPSHYAPRFAPMPTAIAIMDVAYLYFPELFHRRDLYQLTAWTAYSVKRAKRIFTISESTKNDIIKQYRINPEQIIVTYPGIKQASDMDKKPMENIHKKYGIENKYILFVGTLQPRKNIIRLIEAFTRVLEKTGNTNLNLVIVGKKGWLYEKILESPANLHVLDKVKFLDFVPDEDLPQLYKNALCYVLPSLYEGFGLPVLEAMKYGCPVITSNVSSLPEAGGDAALYVDPKNVSDIADKIMQMISSKKLRDQLREKGFKHLKLFSWEKAAKETLDVLVEIAQK